MGKLPFPRLQVLRSDGTWLSWVDGSEWCAPLGANRRDIAFMAGDTATVVEVQSHAESNKLGKLPPRENS